MKTHFTRIATLLLISALLMVGLSTVTAQVTLGPVTQRIIDRGELICGVHPGLAGFGFLNDAGEYNGFDVDFCRAVAVAVLGNATAVTFRPLNAADRQAAIQSGEIDMMSRNTTWTLSRDTGWGAIFAPTTFFDAQGIGTLGSNDATQLADLDGSTICVQTGTTTELNLGDYLARNSLNIEISVYEDANSTWEAYLSGVCQSWTTDKSGIVALHSTAPDPSEHMILADTLSKEPLGPLSPQSDPQFAEIVAWTIYGMIEAEEYGVTSENVDSMMDSSSPPIQRLLGANNNDSGNYLGINNNFMVEVISQVGNYGEVFERNLTPIGLDRNTFNNGANRLWVNGGLIYAPPYR